MRTRSLVILVNDDKDESLADSGGSRPSPGTESTPRGFRSDSDQLICRHAPAVPARLAGHPRPLCLSLGEGAVGDGHPDYASSYGLFTLDTKPPSAAAT